MDELQMPDHVDGLRMEHDGHLNREYKKEVILGNHEEFEWDSESKLGDRLKDIFHRQIWLILLIFIETLFYD